ncbi:MAG: SDR family NAD(P)-dependent oxidoreductase, partial [Pseudomonadota bacterium]
MDHVKGKSIVITGASRGIGAAAARHLAALGGRVVLAARSEGAISEIATEIRADGGDAIAQACDVADVGAVKA